MAVSSISEGKGTARSVSSTDGSTPLPCKSEAVVPVEPDYGCVPLLVVVLSASASFSERLCAPELPISVGCSTTPEPSAGSTGL